jgi:hypothetical protein
MKVNSLLSLPIEVKYRNQTTDGKYLKGLGQLCKKKSIPYAYVITKSLEDFGLLTLSDLDTKIMRIPATLLCYWMGEAELSSASHLSAADNSSDAIETL